jgi:predicted dehydrogenase
MPKLERALELAAQKKLAAYDIMTERYEITSQVMRELVSSRDVFGELVRGDAGTPAIFARSVHHIKKTVAGVALKRPVWFFDIADYGDGLQDVGTHPVDLIQWIAFPDQQLDYRKDVRVENLRREAVPISAAQFQEVTGAAAFPPTLQSSVKGGTLEYRCNGFADYFVRGSHVKIEVLWKWEAPPGGGGDIYEAVFRGTNARIELRQRAAEKFVPEVYVLPASSGSPSPAAALDRAIAKWQARWPGVAVLPIGGGGGIRIVIPERLRLGHEDHFGQVAERFLGYVRAPESMPAWERSYMLAKYAITTSK